MRRRVKKQNLAVRQSKSLRGESIWEDRLPNDNLIAISVHSDPKNHSNNNHMRTLVKKRNRRLLAPTGNYRSQINRFTVKKTVEEEGIFESI
jgi:hypothetical protein